MESSGNSQNTDSDTNLRQSAENCIKQSNSLPVTLSQTSGSKLVNDVDIAKISLSSTRDSRSNSKIESCITSLCELQESLRECEKQIEDQIHAEEMMKQSEENAVQESSKTTENFSVIFAYPARQRPKQPFMVQPPSQSGSQPPPRTPPPPPSYYSPPVPRRPASPAGQESQQTSSAQPEAKPTTEGRRVQQTPRVPLFIDTCRYPWGTTFFMPTTLYNAVVWAPLPTKIPSNVPNCLAHLVVTDSFYIAQISWFDCFNDLDEFFLIQNKNGECLYFVYETMDYGEFALCDSCRAYRLHVMDMYQNEVIFMHKLSGTTSCCCCYPEMVVYAPPGTLLGFVTKKYNFTREEYSLLDPDRNKIFKMFGPCCATCCCWTLEADFTIHAMDENETEVGFIRREIDYFRSYTGSELFGLTLPMDMDVRIKAVFLGAVFLTKKPDRFSDGHNNKSVRK